MPPNILGPGGQPMTPFMRGQQQPQAGPQVPEGYVVLVQLLGGPFDNLPSKLYPIGISAGPDGCGLASVFAQDSENKIIYFHQLQLFGIPYFVTFVLEPKWFNDAIEKFIGKEQKGGGIVK